MWMRLLSGMVAGFFLASVLSGLICWLMPGPWQNALLPALLAFFPLWMGAVIVSFAFANHWPAILSLGSSAAIGFIVLELLRNQGLVQ